MKKLNTTPLKASIMAYILVVLVLLASTAFGQNNVSNTRKQTLAILSIDSKEIKTDPSSIRSMVQLEVEKINRYSVLDKYDIDDILIREEISVSSCYGKSCLVEIGKVLKADKMLTGNIEKMGDKIVITFRLIDVETELIEKVEAKEFINLPEEIHKMITIAVNDLFGIENDANLVNLLVDYNTPISSPKTMLRLNGPRMGVSYTLGDAGERLQAPKNEGGYEMFPVITQFGYQFETQYLSSGTFQALIEYIGMIGGLESGKFIPSIAVMNGFRSSANGWEIAFGPVFKLVKTANGYYDSEGNWNLEYDWNLDNGENPYQIQELPDNRGSVKFKTNLVIGIGRTFKSGYLNIPINLYVIPNKSGTILGASVGFNITKKNK